MITKAHRRVLVTLLLVSGCATSAEDIRARGAYQTLLITKPYKVTAACVAQALTEKYDAGLTVRQAEHATVITEPVDGGGYFLEVTPQGDASSMVRTYASQNMLFFGALSAQMMSIVRRECL